MFAASVFIAMVKFCSALTAKVLPPQFRCRFILCTSTHVRAVLHEGLALQRDEASLFASKKSKPSNSHLVKFKRFLHVSEWNLASTWKNCWTVYTATLTFRYGMRNVALLDIFIFLLDLTSLFLYIFGFVFNVWPFLSILYVSFLFYILLFVFNIRLFLLYNFRLYCIFSHLHCIFLDLYLIFGHFYSIWLHYYCIFLDLYCIIVIYIRYILIFVFNLCSFLFCISHLYSVFSCFYYIIVCLHSEIYICIQSLVITIL